MLSRNEKEANLERSTRICSSLRRGRRLLVLAITLVKEERPTPNVFARGAPNCRTPPESPKPRRQSAFSANSVLPGPYCFTS
jgi:hypothetical protein